MLRDEITRKIYANMHHLMRETGTTAQEAYEAAATSILAIPEIAEALRACEPGGELDVYRANCEYPD